VAGGRRKVAATNHGKAGELETVPLAIGRCRCRSTRALRQLEFIGLPSGPSTPACRGARSRNCRRSFCCSRNFCRSPMGTLRHGSRRYSPLARCRSASTSRGSPVAKNVLHSFTICSPSSTTVLQNEALLRSTDSGQTKPKYCNASIVPRGGPCGSRARRRYTVGCHGCSALIPGPLKRFVFAVGEGRLATEILAGP
jgi:hypothetical protein